MPKLIFRGASIRFVDLRYDDKSKTTYTKLNLTAAFSEPIRNAMEWGEPPAGLSSGKLDGEMNATHFVLTPNGSQLKQHELQLDAREIGAFTFHRVKGQDIVVDELQFQIVTAAPGAAGMIEQYISNIGKGEAQLRVNYEKQAELYDEEGEEETAEETEEAAAEDDGSAPLASATEMGGTHQKKRRRGAEVN